MEITRHPFVKLINVRTIDQLDLRKIIEKGNSFYSVEICKNEQIIFDYIFSDLIKATRFTEQISHAYKENILFDPFRFIIANKLD